MLQLFKIPKELRNFLPYGMALRALGHGFRVTLFGEEPVSGSTHRYLEEAFPELFRSYSWSEFQMERIKPDGIYLLENIPPNLLGDPSFLDLIRSFRTSSGELVLFGKDWKAEFQEEAELITEVVQIRNSHDPNPLAQTEIVTGNGKGKTTYALGEALYHASKGIRSLCLQFIKSPKEYGEIKAAKSLGNLEIRSMGKGFPSEMGTGSVHERAAKNAWGYFLSTMNKGVYGFVVLDEINIALKYAYVDIGEVKGLLTDLKKFKGLALTGRYADGSLYPYVDQILEMREIKHPYHKGIKARRGIEF